MSIGYTFEEAAAVQEQARNDENGYDDVHTQRNGVVGGAVRQWELAIKLETGSEHYQQYAYSREENFTLDGRFRLSIVLP